MTTSRLLVSLPKQFIHSEHYVTTDTDAPLGHHVAADRYLGIALQAKYDMLKSIGLGLPLELGEVGSILVNSKIDYLAECRVGDTLRIDMAFIKREPKSFDWVYRLTNTSSDKEVTRIQARSLAFDYQNNRVTDIPQSFINQIDALAAKNSIDSC